MRKYAVLILIGSVIGCTQMKGVEVYRAENFRLGETRGKNVGLVLINHVRKIDFKKSFDEVYGSDLEFLEYMTPLLTEGLKAHSVRVEKLSPPIAILERIAEAPIRLDGGGKMSPTSLSPRLRRDLSHLASGSQVDMILLVRSWSVSSFIRYGLDFDEPGTERAECRYGKDICKSRTKACVVRLEGGVFDAQGEMLFYGETTGKQDVFLFFDKTALKSAAADAAENFTEMMTGAWPNEALRKLQ